MRGDRKNLSHFINFFAFTVSSSFELESEQVRRKKATLEKQFPAKECAPYLLFRSATLDARGIFHLVNALYARCVHDNLLCANASDKINYYFRRATGKMCYASAKLFKFLLRFFHGSA